MPQESDDDFSGDLLHFPFFSLFQQIIFAPYGLFGSEEFTKGLCVRIKQSSDTADEKKVITVL